MRKKTLVILFTVAIILCVLAIIAETPMLGWSAQCKGTNVCGNPSAIAILGIVVAALSGIAATVLFFIAYIGTLIKQAKQQQWSWFVCTLLFSWITMAIYPIKVPEMEQPAMVMPQYQPSSPGLQDYSSPVDRPSQQPQE